MSTKEMEALVESTLGDLEKEIEAITKSAQEIATSSNAGAAVLQMETRRAIAAEKQSPLAQPAPVEAATHYVSDKELRMAQQAIEMPRTTLETVSDAVYFTSRMDAIRADRTRTMGGTK